MTSAGGPPTAGEWGALLSAPTIPVRELARAHVPDEPGVYLWRHDGGGLRHFKTSHFNQRTSQLARRM